MKKCYNWKGPKKSKGVKNNRKKKKNLMNRKQKRLQLASALFGLGVMLTFTGCKKEEENYNIKYEVIEDEALLVSDTLFTLDIYNAYLKKMGSTKELKEEDLEKILKSTASSLVLVKLENEEYIQVNPKEYSFVENEKGEFYLILNFEIQKVKDYRKDLLTKDLIEPKEKLTILDSLGECIKNANIESIGCAPALYKGATEEEETFIKKYYGEEIWKCFENIGIPRKLYDIEDFYKYYNRDYQTRVLKP